MSQHLEVVEAEPEVATQILQSQVKRRQEDQEREKLAWQTGAFLNGYVSCKVKRWYSFHKFLAERFLGYLPTSGAGSGGGRHGMRGDQEQVPPPPPSPTSGAATGRPEGHGIKAGTSSDELGGGSSVAGAAPGKDGEERSFSVQEVVDAMPIVLFLHVVGCGEYVPGLDELVARDALISDCTAEVRKLLFRQNDSTHTKMVRHRIKETLNALETIGLTRTAFSGDGGAGAAASAPPREDVGEGSKEKDATVHSATSFVVRRRVGVVLESDGGRNPVQTFVFDKEEDVDHFWRTLAVRSRSKMQSSAIKNERADEYDSEDAGEALWNEMAAQRGAGKDMTVFEKFPMLLKRKTWSNLAFGDCTDAQRNSVASFLKRERLAALDQGCAVVGLESLMCSPDAVAVTTRVAKECQLSRAVVAKLLSRIDTKAKAPFSEPLLSSMSSRLNQLSARKRVVRQKPDATPDGEGAAEPGGAAAGKRKGWSVDVTKLKRQRKRRATGGGDGDGSGKGGASAGGNGAKAARVAGGADAASRKAGVGAAGEGSAAEGAQAGAQKDTEVDWEESEGEGEGEGEQEGVGVRLAKPRSRRKIWQLEDDVQLLIVYSQAVEISLAHETASQGSKAATDGGAGGKAETSRAAVLKGRVDWKVVAAALGLKCQQCQRRIKSLSADLPRLRVLYRMTSRGAVETMAANRPGLRLEAAGMGADAICKSMQHVLNNLHLTVSTAPIDHVDKSSLPPDLPATAGGIRKLFKVEPLFPNRQRPHAWPDASPSQACILDLLFLVLSVQQEHYNSELALRLLSRFPEADVERALKLLREKGMIVKRRDGDRSCGLSRALEELMSPSKAYVLLHDQLAAAAGKRRWSLDTVVSGGQVARTVMLLLSDGDKRLKVCA